MDSLTITVAIIALAFAIQVWLRSAFMKTKKKKSPPGPKGFPVVGSLHLLSHRPYRDLQKLSEKYGPIMSIRLGLVPKIVVSSPEAAELFLKTHDLIFSGRPSREASKHLSYDKKSLIFAPNGPYWRDIRKMCTLELLSTQKINSFKPMREDEIGLFLNRIKEAASKGVPVDVTDKLGTLGADMSCRMMFGRKFHNKEFDGKGFKEAMEERLHLSASPNIGDFIPPLAWLDLQGLTKKMKAISKVFDDFFERIIDEHIQYKDDQNRTKDVIDIMLSLMKSADGEYQIGRDHIKAIILDLLLASMDTSTITSEWVLSELLKNPRIMKKLQKELEEKIGMNRMVEESDLEGLEYLDMVIKETFRLHPVGPLLLPHEGVEDATINGYFIPKKSHIIINIWAIGRDPKVWKDAEQFFPERFQEMSVDVRGRDFRLIPFGSGRRSCPGMQLGLTLVRLLVAQMVHCFNWELPNNMLPADLDMSEEFGTVCPRSKPLIAVPTFRLHM